MYVFPLIDLVRISSTNLSSWKSSWQTHHLYKESICFTSTTNPNPGSTSNAINWFALKNHLDQSLCIEISWFRTANGSETSLHPCHYKDNQLWYMDSRGLIRSKLNINKCLEENKIWDCHGDAWQQWELSSDGRLRNKHHNKYLGVSNGCDGVSSGDKTQLQTKYTSGNCARQQQWVTFVPTFRLFHNALNREYQ